MNRREFTKLLAIAPFAATLAPSLFIDDDSQIKKLDFTIMNFLSISGVSQESRRADINVFRSNNLKQLIINFSLNAMGGNLYWRASPIYELIFLEESYPIIQCDDPDILYLTILDTAKGSALLSHEHKIPVYLNYSHG